MLENYYIALLIFILGFGFLVFVHELGHFLVAKWVGIRCTQFAVCFGQALLSFRKGLGIRAGSTESEYRRRALAFLQSDDAGDLKLPSDQEPSDYQLMQAADRLGLGETEYRLNWIPLGGYVKMVGQEDLDPSARSEDPRAYSNKSIGKRLAVISAGVVMNIISGFVFFIIAFSIGVKFPTSEIGMVALGSPAATTYAQGHEDDPDYFGLRVGDRVAAIDGTPVRDMLDVKMNTALAAAGSTLTYTVERPGVDGPLKFPLRPVYQQESGLLQTGIGPAASLQVGLVQEGTSAAEAGVEPGMVIVAVDGQPVDSYAAYRQALATEPLKEKRVTFKDAKSDRTVTVTMPPGQPTLSAADTDQPPNLLGLVPLTRITAVSEDSPAAEAGIEADDVLVRVGDREWPSLEQVSETVRAAGGQAVTVVVEREGEQVELGEVTPNAQGLLGIAIGPAYETNRVSRVLPHSAAASLKLLPGSRVLTINGMQTPNFSAIQNTLKQQVASNRPSSNVSIKYELNMAGQPQEMAGIAMTPLDAALIAQASWLRPGDVGLEQKMVTLVAGTPWQAMSLGVEKTSQFMVQTYLTLLRLFQGSVAASNLHGPLGIVSTGTIFAQRGWSYLLFFLGLISVNLAVLNFLPIPIVDGGHAVFLLYEKITGTPPGEKFQTASMLVGLALLGGLFLFVTYHDIVRIMS